MLFIHVSILLMYQTTGCGEHVAMTLSPHRWGSDSDSVVLDMHSPGYKQVKYAGELKCFSEKE